MLLYNGIIAIFYVLAMKITTAPLQRTKGTFSSRYATLEAKIIFFRGLSVLEIDSRSTCMAEGF